MTEQEKQAIRELCDKAKILATHGIVLDALNKSTSLLNELDERDREVERLVSIVEDWKRKYINEWAENQRLRKAFEEIAQYDFTDNAFEEDRQAILWIVGEALYPAGEEKESEYPCQGCGKELGTEWEKYCVVCQLNSKP